MIYVFWICTFVFLYAYLIYPIIVHRIAKKQVINKCNNKVAFDDLPEITVVMGVYNGEFEIIGRLNNIFESNYPKEKIHVIVVSDGSTDGTVEAVNMYPEVNVLLIESEKNVGKAGALNLAYPNIKTDLVAFCDIRQSFCENALIELVQSFDEDSVGAVTGNLIIRNDDDNAESDPGLYWKYEKWIRDNEGKIRSLVGVTGAIYMARTKLLPLSLPDDTILDDMFVPLSIVKAGYNVKMANEAYAFDVSSATIKEEFHRKVRTLAGNFQLMRILPWVNSLRNPLVIQWLSHKIARLMVPYALIGIMISSIFLEGVIYDLAFIAQVIFYTYGAVSYSVMKENIKPPLGSVIVNFITLNYAALLAGWKFYFGSASSLWKKH
jgi:biofilm PGA synthesis N-glycosyltransferase PgaC